MAPQNVWWVLVVELFFGDVTQTLSLGDIAEEEIMGKVTPLLSRRNSVARCSGVLEDMRGKAGMQRLRLARNRAATDNEFTLLMERIQEECAPALSSKTPSRKSLPAGALKSYMRSTVSSVRRSHGSSGLQSSQDDLVKPEGKIRRGSQVPNKQQPSLQRKKIVPVKPSIPPVLLKAAVTGGAMPEGEAQAPSEAAGGRSERKHKSESTSSRILGGEGGQGGGSLGQCGGQCKGCQLVDLWFTFWHVQFNERVNSSPSRPPPSPSSQCAAELNKTL